MKAITLWQPWSWAIAYAGKRIENRGWKPPAAIIGQRIAIHAGKTLDLNACEGLGCEDDIQLPEMYFHDPKKAFVHGAIESTALLKGWTEGLCSSHPQSLWLTGPIGWVLDDVVVLPRPILCRGAQGLWNLPRETERLVLEQVS